jgi:hypothetical protein
MCFALIICKIYRQLFKEADVGLRENVFHMGSYMGLPYTLVRQKAHTRATDVHRKHTKYFYKKVLCKILIIERATWLSLEERKQMLHLLLKNKTVNMFVKYY